MNKFQQWLTGKFTPENDPYRHDGVIFEKPEKIKMKRKTVIIVTVCVLCVVAATIAVPLSFFYRFLVEDFCGRSLDGLGLMTEMNARDYDDNVLDGNNWCNIFIEELDAGFEHFRCAGSDAIKGESSYAINENALGKKFSELPEDMVLFFETNMGRKDTKRTKMIKERPSLGKYPDPQIVKLIPSDTKVYLKRWNQVGGSEDLTMDNHRGKGCWVCFGNGRRGFVKAKEVDKLRWTVE